MNAFTHVVKSEVVGDIGADSLRPAVFQIVTGIGPLARRLIAPRVERAGKLASRRSLPLRLTGQAELFARSSAQPLTIRGRFVPVDTHHRLLAYLAPNYSAAERKTLTRAQRATFNLDMVVAGWAATFVIYPSIPGELDLPMLLDAAATARTTGRGIWADPLTLPGYEYRCLERLHEVTAKIVAGEDVAAAERFSWRERYCADMRDRVLHGPEDYSDIEPEYRLWFWAADVGEAVSRLNLTPAPALVAA